MWKGAPTPWHIARIMEFLPYSRVRVQMYFRPSDVNDRASADPRTLYLAIQSEVIEVGQLRGKCYVAHKDSIADLAVWKKHPDRFIFTKFFDVYVKRDFEIVRTADIRNRALLADFLPMEYLPYPASFLVPENILRTLKSRYEYVVTEKDHTPKLLCEFSTCATCSQWANPCVIPPRLTARPLTRIQIMKARVCMLLHMRDALPLALR